MKQSAVGTKQESRSGFCDGGEMQFDDFYEGIAFMYPIDQAVLISEGNKSGKVLSEPILGNHYIVLLDHPGDGSKAVIVHGDGMQLVTCHWCRDSQEVPVTPITGEQYDSCTIPTKPCPYCTEKVEVETHG